MLIWCLNPRDCTSTTSWIDFLIAIWILILWMIKTNGKMNKKWSKWTESGATWARIRALEARLAVYVTFYFPGNIIKNTCIKFFIPQSGILNKSAIRVVLITMCMNVAREPIFIYRWNVYFFILSPIYFLIMFFTWHKIFAKKNILQFNAVVVGDNQYDEFLLFNCTQNSTHLKIMDPGLRGPVGGPCKSEDITGWGLTLWYIFCPSHWSDVCNIMLYWTAL